jgi:uncharacterized protein YcfJ
MAVASVTDFDEDEIMKKVKIIIGFGAAILATSVSVNAFANGPVRYDYARVVEAEPITSTVRVSTPREECWQEQVVHEERRPGSATGAILGGIIGAAVGNELGHHKSNKRVGAVAGAILGSSVGHDVSRREHHRYTSLEDRCRTYNDYHEEQRVTGYNVLYRYNGEVYSTRTSRHPGDSLKIKVSITPIL